MLEDPERAVTQDTDAGSAAITAKRFAGPLDDSDSVLLRVTSVHVHDASEPEVIGSRADFAFPARAHDIPRAILIRAEERASPVHFLSLIGLGRIVGDRRPLRIARHSSGRGELPVVIGPIPIARPLPDIPGHVV